MALEPSAEIAAQQRRSSERKREESADLQQRFGQDQAYQHMFDEQSAMLTEIVGKVRGDILHRRVNSTMTTLKRHDAQNMKELQQTHAQPGNLCLRYTQSWIAGTSSYSTFYAQF